MRWCQWCKEVQAAAANSVTELLSVRACGSQGSPWWELLHMLDQQRCILFWAAHREVEAPAGWSATLFWSLVNSTEAGVAIYVGSSSSMQLFKAVA